MKTNTAIIILLGIAITCHAQSTNPPSSQKPDQPHDAFVAESKDPLTSGGVTIVKSKDGHAFIAEPGDASLTAKPAAPALDPFAASGNVRVIRRQDGSVFIEDANTGKQPATDPTLGAGNGNVRILSRDAAVELARDLAKKGRYDEARALLNDEMPDGATARVSKDGHVSGEFVTRLYPLNGLISKSPAEIDDDAHNRKANDAYAAKVEILNQLWKTVLEHSDPAGAGFTYSSDAGLFVVRATEAQHDLLRKAAQLLEENKRQ